MLSVKDLDINMLDLEPEEKVVLMYMPLEKAVEDIRTSNYYDFRVRAMVFSVFPKSTNRFISNLRKKLYHEMQRLDMFRHDFYDSERFTVTANIMALLEMVTTSYSGSYPAHYYYFADYIPRLITKLDNDSYENWDGFSDGELDKIITFFKLTLSSEELMVLSLRFGLTDGRCLPHQEIASRLSFVSTPEKSRKIQQNAIKKLIENKDEFVLWCKLSMDTRD